MICGKLWKKASKKADPFDEYALDLLLSHMFNIDRSSMSLDSIKTEDVAPSAQLSDTEMNPSTSDEEEDEEPEM